MIKKESSIGTTTIFLYLLITIQLAHCQVRWTTEAVDYIRCLYPSYCPETRILKELSDSNKLELHNSCFKKYKPILSDIKSHDTLTLMALFISPLHDKDYKYNENGNYSIHIALLKKVNNKIKLVAQTERPYSLLWEEEPHWKQKMLSIDTMYLAFGKKQQIGCKVACKAEYHYKLQTDWIEKNIIFDLHESNMRPILNVNVKKCNCCPEGTEIDLKTCGENCFNEIKCIRYYYNFKITTIPNEDSTMAPVQLLDSISKNRINYFWDVTEYKMKM